MTARPAIAATKHACLFAWQYDTHIPSKDDFYPNLLIFMPIADVWVCNS
jgi:hypothetical protein